MPVGKGGSRAESAAAQGKVDATATTAFYFFLPFQRVVGPAQFGQHFRRGSRLGVPQVGEQVIFHVAERHGLPELIRMHGAVNRYCTRSGQPRARWA